MSPTFEDYGYTVADIQSLMSSNLHATILFAFCHGIHTCIFFIVLYYQTGPSESSRLNWKQITLFGVIAFLWCANTVILGMDWKVVDQLFIDHGTSLETEFTFYLQRGSDASWELVVTLLHVLSVLVADVIVIWRCWVLYGENIK
ncbi:hypothetical protein BDZ89DRAFT_1063381, partial [Hymenopellis radicata]